jgi:hypothetical protein
MKNLRTYEEFLAEYRSNFTAEDNSRIIISKETSNGKVVFRDSSGNIITKNQNLPKIEEDNALSQTADITRDPSQVNSQNTSINTDPNRTVGTGTYTSTRHDVSPTTKGTWDPTDSSSGGTIPVYVGN